MLRVDAVDLNNEYQTLFFHNSMTDSAILNYCYYNGFIILNKTYIPDNETYIKWGGTK